MRSHGSVRSSRQSDGWPPAAARSQQSRSQPRRVVAIHLLLSLRERLALNADGPRLCGYRAGGRRSLSLLERSRTSRALQTTLRSFPFTRTRGAAIGSVPAAGCETRVGGSAWRTADRGWGHPERDPVAAPAGAAEHAGRVVARPRIGVGLGALEHPGVVDRPRPRRRASVGVGGRCSSSGRCETARTVRCRRRAARRGGPAERWDT